MNILLQILFALVMLAVIGTFIMAAIENIRNTRTKSRHDAAEARMFDEIGRKLAGNDATIIPPAGVCLDPSCPAHGKDNN